MNKDKEKISQKIIGIDLGTTNSVISYVKVGENKPEILVNKDGDRTTPSVVCIKKGEIIVGKQAKNLSVVMSDYVVSSIKTLTGSGKKVSLGKKKFSVPEIQAMILGYLVDCASEFLSEKIVRVVITVPAYFNDNQRRITQEAAKIAGLTVERIINEPTAAALAYGLGNSNSDKKNERKILVFDLGGGTFDVSVIAIDYQSSSKEGVFEVLATKGDVKLGGDDFDNVIYQMLRKKFLKEHGIDIDTDVSSKQRGKNEAEKIKKNLSNAKTIDVQIPYLYKDKSFNTTFTRSEFEHECKQQKLIDRINKILDESIKDSKIKKSEIDEVLLAGGSTRMPMINELLVKIFGQEKIKRDNPDEVVAMGAAIQGSILSGQFGSKIVLVDTIPMTLGLAVNGQFMHKLIERNSNIPCSKEDIFTTGADNQTTVVISVYQGESPLIKNNKLLGEFSLENIKPAKKGIPKIRVKFSVDANSILSVHAKDLDTGSFKEIEIKSDTMSKEEIEQKIKEYNDRKEQDMKEKEKLVILDQIDTLYYDAKELLNSNASNMTDEQHKDFSDKLQKFSNIKEMEDDMKILQQNLVDLKNLQSSIKSVIDKNKNTNNTENKNTDNNVNTEDDHEKTENDSQTESENSTEKTV